jgi:hypothetical protein
MPILQLVAAEGKQVNGPLRICLLPAGDETHLLPTPTPMPETPTSQAGSSGSPQGMARSIEQQIEQMERMAAQHFPDDAEARGAYLVGLLKTRLREYAAKFVRLEVR